MKHSQALLGLTLAALLSGCRSSPAGRVIGGEMKTQESYRLALVEAEPERFFDRTVLVEARVVAVCQKKGCWMQIEDEGRTAMVRWESGCGGDLAFPKDAAGKRVLVLGSFYRKRIDPEDVEHIREEALRPIAIPNETYELNASSVKLLDEPTG